MSASLLLSLHQDSVQPRYLQDWQSDGRLQRFSDEFWGYSLFMSTLNARPDDSRRFATQLGSALNTAGFAPSSHHAERIPGEGKTLLEALIGLYRYDDLVVLRTASMPAVLLEAGIIVNREEELELRDPTVIGHGRSPPQ